VPAATLALWSIEQGAFIKNKLVERHKGKLPNQPPAAATL